MIPTITERPVAVLYEHHEWFEPLFAALARQGVPYRRWDARERGFDPADPFPAGEPEPALVLNRMSPSAALRGLPGAVAWTRAHLAAWEERGVRVVNGRRAFRFETSKAAQLSLLASMGLPHPRSRVVHSPAGVPAAAREIGFPLVVKPNLGGSGAGIRRFADEGQLRGALEVEDLDLGPDGTALVQEWIPARGGVVTRFEVLDGRLLYAIDVTAPSECFDLCPADLVEGDAAGRGVEAARPTDAQARAAESIVSAAGIEVGGVEGLIDDRDGSFVFYDVNALSNFVADPLRVVGLDPFDRLAVYLAREMRAAASSPSTGRHAALEGRAA